MKDRTFINLAGFFFLLFFAGIAMLSLDKPINQYLRAKNVNPSPLKSFAIVFPQVASISDKKTSSQVTDIKVTVTMRDVNGSTLPNRRVKLSSSLEGTVITPADTQITNELGQTQFILTSTSTGKAILTATDMETNTALVNIPSVEFIE